ncbi:MAG: PGN_0703 family putative restriction endonuclease [Candidatus Hodarchaeales archaeon]
MTHMFYFESKFTETSGGTCSQVKPLQKGSNKGKIQCNGQYEIQTNPMNNIESKCALTGKNIRYWEYLDKIFKKEIYSTKGCPFSGSWYQWMRNLTVCYAVAKNQRKKPVFILIYVDGISFPIAQEIKSKEWLRFKNLIKSDEILLKTISYQELLQIYADIMYSTDTENQLLVDWVESKIQMVDILKKFKTIT